MVEDVLITIVGITMTVAITVLTVLLTVMTYRVIFFHVPGC